MAPMAMVDLDGTITAGGDIFRSILEALHNAGWHISIVTGDTSDRPIKTVWKEKSIMARDLVGNAWDELVVVQGNIAKQKAQWAMNKPVDLAIDNDTRNAKALIAAGVPIILVPWGTREK